MTDWLIDTLLWTAGLIVLVLLVRRPVARWFGPQVTYALWALPMLRLMLPPIELPVWLNPAPQAGSIAAETLSLIVHPQASAATPGRMDAASGSVMPNTPLPLLEIGIAVWLTGAALYLAYRFGMYFRLRRELLSDAREVGRSDRIRMVETPGTKAPLALGVLNPVIALPEGFMSQPDRDARDLAIAHELAHHRGKDLLVNFAVQPLFSLHWFNPLAHYGWLALRRDQEAACDARVMASKSAEERATYANLIAGFAAGPNVTLAAPMACPVLGDKSIVHRLRSLKMSDISSRRRIAGRAFLGAAVLALPLTASISYAETVVDAPVAPEAPSVAQIAPVPPVPPAPPAPQAPEAAPNPLPAPAPAPNAIEVIDPTPQPAPVARPRVSQREVVARYRSASWDGEAAAEPVSFHRVSVSTAAPEMSDVEIEEVVTELREALAQADIAIAETKIQISKEMKENGKLRTSVKMECRGDSDDVSTVEQNADGGQTVFLCQARVMAHALKGLKEARKSIETNRELTGKLRSRILETLDEQISQWEAAQLRS